MSDMTGNYLRARSSGSTEVAADGLDAKILLLLLGLGVAIVLLHQAFRFPLNLPGRHGLDAMALMAMGRLAGGYRWSAGLVGASAGGTALLVGAGPLAPVLYPLVGILMDLGTRLLPHWRTSLFVLPVIAGLAWASRPLVRWFTAHGTGMEFGSLVHGLAWPVFTHMLFGAVGGLVAVLAWRGWQKRRTG